MKHSRSARCSLGMLALVLLPGLPGCGRDPMSPITGEVATPRDGGRQTLVASYSVIRGDLARTFVSGYARALAAAGDSRLLDHLKERSEGRPSTSDPAVALTTPEDGPPHAEILSKDTYLTVDGAYANLDVSMTFRGDIAEQSTNFWAMNEATGEPSVTFPPFEDSKWSFLVGYLLTDDLETIVPITLPQSCDLHLTAATTHKAWLSLVPAPKPISDLLPITRYGQATAASSMDRGQSSCAVSGGGGTGGGGGSGAGGVLMGTYACYYEDFYDSATGAFLYTVSEGCQLIAVWNQT